MLMRCGRWSSRVGFSDKNRLLQAVRGTTIASSPRETYRAVRMRAISKNSAAGEIGSSQRPRMPPLKALLAFEAASRHGSFSRAAEELGVTPSAVSHHIQNLEDFLGVQGFSRHAGPATLTNA